MKKNNIILYITLILIIIFLSGEQVQQLPNDDWLHTDGNRILDKDNNYVRITGINYFGFETENMVFQGLWGSDLNYCLDLIADSGFNLIRIPLSIDLVNKWRNGIYPMPSEGSVNLWQMNEYLEGMNSLEILDYTVAYCKNNGLKIMFDMHQVLKDRKRNGWIFAGYTVEDFYSCWEWITIRYQNDDTVIAMDLFNEPHGKVYLNNLDNEGPPVIWNNSTLDTNFKHVAEIAALKILNINPNLLIMIEGIQSYPKDPINNDYILTDYNDKDQYHETWWGGNLRGVIYYPINLGQYQSQLVYEPHDYGPRVWAGHPWFREGFTKEILFNECWQPNWFFIHEQDMAPLLIGEWGSKLDNPDDIKWFNYFISFVEENQFSYTYWCFNPNSHDTGGIVNENYELDETKYNMIKSTIWMTDDGKGIGLDHQTPLGKNGTNITQYYSSSSSSSSTSSSSSSSTSSSSTSSASSSSTSSSSTSSASSSSTSSSSTSSASSSSTSSSSTSSSSSSSTSSSSTSSASSSSSSSTSSASSSLTSSSSISSSSSSSINYTYINTPFMQDGIGEYYWKTENIPSYINSWGLELLDINDISFTNVYKNTNGLPNKINGYYYIHYKSINTWGHFEAR